MGNLEALFSILSYHVVVDEAVLSRALSMGQQIQTAQGENIIITITNAEPICEEVCTYPDALCPAPMYYSSDNYLGEYSNNPSLGPVTPSDDFGLDAYEPQFFYPLLRWKGTPKEEDPEGPGYYQAALHIPVDEEFMGDFFYFCHIHQYMTGRFKFVDEDGFSISPINTPRIPYEHQEPVCGQICPMCRFNELCHAQGYYHQDSIRFGGRLVQSSNDSSSSTGCEYVQGPRYRQRYRV